MALLTEEPDVSFDELYDAWKMVAQLEETLSEMESELDRARALFKQQCMVEETMWPNNRPPSMEYLKQIVHYVGNNKNQANVITEYEKNIAEVHQRLIEAKGFLDALHWKLKVWQTKSANARKTLVE